MANAFARALAKRMSQHLYVFFHETLCQPTTPALLQINIRVYMYDDEARAPAGRKYHA